MTTEHGKILRFDPRKNKFATITTARSHKNSWLLCSSAARFNGTRLFLLVFVVLVTLSLLAVAVLSNFHVDRHPTAPSPAVRNATGASTLDEVVGAAK